MTVSKVVLAKLSPTMEEGTIVKWTKKEGDPVKQGDVLAEIETDKANMEMEALGSGVLRKILVPAGGKAPIGALIGVIAEPNEDIEPLIAKEGAKAGSAPKPAAAPAPAAQAPAAPAAPTGSADAAAAKSATPAPAAAAPAPGPAKAAADATAKAAPADQSASVASAAQTPPVPAAPAPTSAAPAAPAGPSTGGDGGRVKASPLARSMAAHQNIDLSSVAGSGPGGRIIKRDIESWAGPRPGAAAPARSAGAPASRPSSAASRPAPPGPSITPGQELPLSNMRKTIAKRLSESKFTSPHYYVTVEIDMDAAVDLRDQIQRLEEGKVSFNDLVVKACARALTRFPMVNASWGGDKIVTHADVNIGIAVAIPDGLITPVVRNADRKSILDIASEVRDLATRARDRKLKPEEFTGSTFTISNLGMFDVDAFTAIINPPDSAILAVGAVRKVPVVDGETIRPGHRMKVTMSSDHRVIDGALSAQFLAEVRRLLEAPVGLLLG
jgi:pyruvate dehydrogenase E2 component (dihydrolipoamide acetyltransferase)